MESAEQERINRPPLTLLTCRTPDCQVCHCTTTPGEVDRGEFTRKWKVEAAYDPLTGCRHEI